MNVVAADVVWLGDQHEILSECPGEIKHRWKKFKQISYTDKRRQRKQRCYAVLLQQSSQ
ncbi:hypothetical protein VRB95_20360 [Erwinia aphidicola]|jgi:hypothetical protein|uniref:Uncharacterized protein n=1 Tax=Erwinia aphidicola TaxID=68334 RepID=A0ABU8DD50_ERWAP|nr:MULTISPECIES: hypothetical protein [Erwinia]MBN1084159.1 hypothetical protein [Erwinia aphidicola]MCP2231043.1 hypothetical protein [Erwinia aphidicola]MDI3439088.1 hypothetical protein [Erwinia sp. V90_4]